MNEKKVTSLHEQIFEYVKAESIKSVELHRKNIISYFEDKYGRNKRSTLSSIRSATDKVLQYLGICNFIIRRNYCYRIINSDSGEDFRLLRGYYHFLKVIPEEVTWRQVCKRAKK